MAIEYRPARSDEMRAFVRANQIGFGAAAGEADVDRALAHTMNQPEWTLCAFEDGAPVSQMTTYPFTMRWNGRDLSCGGVTSVSTLPTHRRRGHLRELMTRSFATMRDAGQPVAMLWASMAAIYQRFGYGIAFTNHVSSFRPRDLRFVDSARPRGRVRLLPTDEAPVVLGPVYERFAAPRTLMLHRSDEMWRQGVLRVWPPDSAPYLIAVYEESDEALGYVIYSVEQARDRRPGPDLTLHVPEFVWLATAAHRALVELLAGYDLAEEVRLYRMAADDPLFHLVDEPRLLNIKQMDGTLVRLTDVRQALEGRGYNADGAVSFVLHDDLCPWNSGGWRLTVDGGKGRLAPASETAIEVTPRALAMLASGHVSATALSRAGMLTASGPAALAAADALFRVPHAPLCLDGF
ncbi:MAG: GNAT family N-acetyltransferase [Dehalococcoidia bacterium]